MGGLFGGGKPKTPIVDTVESKGGSLGSDSSSSTISNLGGAGAPTGTSVNPATQGGQISAPNATSAAVRKTANQTLNNDTRDRSSLSNEQKRRFRGRRGRSTTLLTGGRGAHTGRGSLHELGASVKN